MSIYKSAGTKEADSNQRGKFAVSSTPPIYQQLANNWFAQSPSDPNGLDVEIKQHKLISSSILGWAAQTNIFALEMYRHSK
jgi:hypothetical protein